MESQDNIVIENAVITHVMWAYEHDVLVYRLRLQGNGWVHIFDSSDLKDNNCYLWILGLIDTFELKQFNDGSILNKIIRVKLFNKRVVAIGHPIKDLWLTQDGLKRYSEE
jgi:hypothetical protein